MRRPTDGGTIPLFGIRLSGIRPPESSVVAVIISTITTDYRYCAQSARCSQTWKSLDQIRYYGIVNTRVVMVRTCGRLLLEAVPTTRTLNLSQRSCSPLTRKHYGFWHARMYVDCSVVGPNPGDGNRGLVLIY